MTWRAPRAGSLRVATIPCEARNPRRPAPPLPHSLVAVGVQLETANAPLRRDLEAVRRWSAAGWVLVIVLAAVVLGCLGRFWDREPTMYPSACSVDVCWGPWTRG